MIQEHLKFIETSDPLLIQYSISGHANNDSWKDILVLLNGNTVDKTIKLPAGSWTLAADGNTVNEKGIKKVMSEINLPATTAYILYRL